MLAIGSCTARRRFQVADGGFRTKVDRAASSPPAVGKFTFEIVGDANEIFVEAAECKGLLPPQREIAAHEPLDLPPLRRCELSRRPRRIRNIVIPRLQDAAGHQPVAIAMRIHVRGHQVGTGHDVVIENRARCRCRLRAILDSSPLESTVREAEATGSAHLRSSHEAWRRPAAYARAFDQAPGSRWHSARAAARRR